MCVYLYANSAVCLSVCLPEPGIHLKQENTSDYHRKVPECIDQVGRRHFSGGSEVRQRTAWVPHSYLLRWPHVVSTHTKGLEIRELVIHYCFYMLLESSAKI